VVVQNKDLEEERKEMEEDIKLGLHSQPTKAMDDNDAKTNTHLVREEVLIGGLENSGRRFPED